MPQTRMIAINGQVPATFDLPTLNAGVGDLINWQNNTSEPHWLAPRNQAKDTWMDAAIPAKAPGQPAPTSQQALSFSVAANVVYVCNIQGHEREIGRILIT